MKNAWQLFKMVLLGVIHNFWPLSKMFLPSLLIVAIPFIAIFIWMFAGAGQNFAIFAIAFIALYVISFVTVAGLAINFHRYFLADERQITWRPFNFDWRRALKYFGYAFLLGLIVGLATLPIRFLEGFLDRNIWMYSTILGALVLLIISLAEAVIYQWLYLRFCLVLPGLAMDGKIGLDDSWRKTSRVSGLLWKLSFIYILFFGGILVLVGLVGSVLTPVGQFSFDAPVIFTILRVFVVILALGFLALFWFVTLGLMTELYRRLAMETE